MTDKDQIIELCSNRDSNGLTFRDIGKQFGLSKDAVRGIYRRWMDKQLNDNLSLKLDSKLNNIEKTIGSDRLLLQQLREEKRQIDNIKRDLGRTSVLADYIKIALEELDIYKRLPYPEIYYKSNIREGIIQLSDLHDGVIVKKSHTNGYNEYNPKILEERLYKFLEQIIYFGQLYNIQKMNVFGLADYIEHDSMRSTQVASVAYPVVEQMMHCEELIYNWLVDLSKYFIIEFDGVSGNHDRMSGDKNKELKENNLSSLLLHMVKLRLSNNHPNIIYNYTFNNQAISKNILGYWILGKHGHEEIGNKLEKLKDHIMMDGIDYQVFLYGHLHNFKVETGSRGKKAIGNGSIMGSNDFSRTHLYCNTNASQNLLILEQNKGIIGYHEIDLQ